MSEFVVGIDLGGTNIKTALVDTQGQIVVQESRPTDAGAGPEAIMDAMQAAMDAVIAQAGTDKGQVATVGIGVPGPMNWQTGIVYSPPNLEGWKDVHLADGMKARLGIPVFVDNDANVACYGEFWSGAGKGCDTMVLMTLGTGVGGGIVVHGKLLRGIDGTAAEIGHMQLMRDGRRHPFGFTGTLEAYASVTGLKRTAREAIEGGRESILTERCGGDLDNLTGKMISEAIAEGDEVAAWSMRETGIWLGLASATLINLLNPEKILFSGGMIAAGDILFDTIRETAKKQSFEVPYKRCVIETAALGEDAGVIGAAGCAWERFQAEGPR